LLIGVVVMVGKRGGVEPVKPGKPVTKKPSTTDEVAEKSVKKSAFRPARVPKNPTFATPKRKSTFGVPARKPKKI
jgi:hypothetical protein